MLSQKSITSTLYVFVQTLCVVIILAYVALSYWTFVEGDSFWYARLAKDHDILSSLEIIRNVWSGRFATYLFSYAIGIPAIYPFHTNLFVLLSNGFFWLALGILLKRINGKIGTLTLIDLAYFALILPFRTKREVFYWLDGNIPYLLPISFACLLAAYIDKPFTRIFSSVMYAMLFAFAAFIATFNEGASVFFILCIAVFLADAYVRNDALMKPRFTALLLGSIVGLAIDMSAPGNYSRLNYQPIGTLHLTGIVDIALETAYGMRINALPFILLAFSYALVRAYYFQPVNRLIARTRKQWVCIVFLLCVISGASLFPAYYVYHGDFTGERILMVIEVSFFVAALCFSNAIGAYARHIKYSYVVIPFMIALWPLSTGIGDLIVNLKNASLQRHAVLAQINAGFEAQRTSKSALTLEPIPSYNRSFYSMHKLSEDPGMWQNNNFSYYFGLKQTRVVAK